MPSESRRRPNLLTSITPVVFLVIFLYYNIAILEGSGHLPLIFGAAIAAAIANFFLGIDWRTIQQGMVKGITSALPAVLILMIVGLLIGVWIASGVVPLLIYYGLNILRPSYFLLATCLICSLVSLVTGSSWTTAATVGLALVGVGNTLGVSAGMTAGAIISGSYFGDKMSPLSDTTNLAPATAGTDLFTHIRHMFYTTVPSLVIALTIYMFIGFSFDGSASVSSPEYLQMIDTLNSAFNLSPFLLLAPAAVLILVLRKTPALPALLVGVLVGGVLLLTVQYGYNGRTFGQGMAVLFGALYEGYQSNTGVAMVDQLLTQGGLVSMLNTIALIIVALAFGGVMEVSNMLSCIAENILKMAKSTGTLVVATIGSCLGMNILASDQYIAIVVPGRMYRTAYLKRGLHPKNLSRALEDSGTLTSPLVPWNTCGAYMAGVLGVSTFAYAPFAFLNMLNPLVSIFYGFTGITMQKIEDDPETVLEKES